MADTFDNLKNRSEEVKNENRAGQNQAIRIGQLFFDVVDKIEEVHDDFDGTAESIMGDINKVKDDIQDINTQLPDFLRKSGGTMEGNILFAPGKGIKSNSGNSPARLEVSPDGGKINYNGTPMIQIYDLSVFNLSEYDGDYSIPSKATARSHVQINFRAHGKIIIYRLGTGEWVLEQFFGDSVNNDWNDDSKWRNLAPSNSTPEIPETFKPYRMVVDRLVYGLPLRAHKGDCVMIKDENNAFAGNQLFECVYDLRYLVKKSRYTGDPQLQDQQTTVTDFIDVTGSDRVVISCVSMYPNTDIYSTTILDVVFYDSGNHSSSIVNIEIKTNCIYKKINIPAGAVKLRIVVDKQNMELITGFLKVYKVSSLVKDINKLYRYNGEEWMPENIPQGTFLPLKNGYYEMRKYNLTYQKVPSVQIPKLEIRSTKFTLIFPETFTILNQEQISDNRYYVSIYRKVYRRRSKGYKLKNRTCFSKQTMVSYSEFTGMDLRDLFQMSFFQNPNGSYITKTGLYRKIKIDGSRCKLCNYVDYAVCLTMRINKKWVNGPMTFFRIKIPNNLSLIRNGEGIGCAIALDVK